MQMLSWNVMYYMTVAINENYFVEYLIYKFNTNQLFMQNNQMFCYRSYCYWMVKIVADI